MGIFIKFKCSSCGENTCNCAVEKVEPKTYYSSNTTPEVKELDMIRQDNKTYIISKVTQDGTAFKKVVSFFPREEESVLYGEYELISNIGTQC